jgi:hypothetical protein
LAFYIAVSKAKTLKYLITYNNLRTYINPRTYINLKGMIGMPVIDRYVWGHAYGHDMGALTIFGKDNFVFSYFFLGEKSSKLVTKLFEDVYII